jgi:hypothetical protein
MKEKEIFAADISQRYGKRRAYDHVPYSRLAVVDLFLQ